MDINIKDYFTGTDLWKTLLLGSGYVFLIILMGLMAGQMFDSILPLLLGYCVWIAVAFTLMREQKIKNLTKYGGMRILTGPLDEEEDKGELVEFEVKKITRYYKLPQNQRKSIIELVHMENKMVDEMDKREMITYRINRSDPKRVKVDKEDSTNKNKKKDNVKKIDVEEDNIEEDYIGDDDIISIDKDFEEDMIRYPKEPETNKKVKNNGKKIIVKKKKKRR